MWYRVGGWVRDLASVGGGFRLIGNYARIEICLLIPMYTAKVASCWFFI